MSNRLRVYYPYRCTLCGTVQYRGSAATFCHGHPLIPRCRGLLRRLPGGARARPLRVG